METPQVDGFKGLIGRKLQKEVEFMSVKIKISKLSVSQVLEIQEHAKKIQEDEKEGFNVLKTVIKASVEGAESMTDEEFNQFPLDELQKLSEQIMEFSGIQNQGNPQASA